MNETILKDDELRINLSQTVEINKILNIDKIINNDYLVKPLKLNGFIIEKKESFYFITKGRFFDERKLLSLYNEIKESSELLLIKYKDLFIKLKDNKKIITSDINIVVKYTYYELFLYLEIAAYKHNLNIEYEKEKRKINQIVGKELNYSEKKGKKDSKNFVRTKLIQRSLNSKYWNRKYHSKTLEIELIKTIEKINPIEIEFPRSYNKENLYKLLKSLNTILKEIKMSNNDFEIRFKKIAIYKKEGLYIKNAKCIIVDPRKTNALFHELAHFIHETNKTFYWKGKKITKKRRLKLINENKLKYKDKLKNHKIEELDELSETFAYWFEENVIYDILNK